MALVSGPNTGLLAYGLPGEAHYTELTRQWRWIDFFLNPRVINMVTNAPPGSPTNGDTYIVGPSPTGAWAGWANRYARWTTEITTPAWESVVPKSGWMIYNVADGNRYSYSGSAWAVFSGGGGTAPNVQAVTSSATVTPTFTNDAVKITAQAVNLTIANPTGTAVDMWSQVIRIKDNGTARTITWGSQFRGIGFVLPSTTVINKTLYVSSIWNTEDTKWDVVAVGQE